jgi:hypothetical protein
MGLPLMGSAELGDGPFSILGDVLHVPVGTNITTATCARSTRFARDSSLEGDGFEPSVPLGREVLEGRTNRLDW